MRTSSPIAGLDIRFFIPMRLRSWLYTSALFLVASTLLNAQSATTTTLTASPGPTSSFGQTVTLTATVNATGATAATGIMTFRDGATTLGTTGPVGGVATLTISTLAVGSHSLTASYGGDTNFLASTSTAITQTVTVAS